VETQPQVEAFEENSWRRRSKRFQLPWDSLLNGDDVGAKEQVLALGQGMGFDPVDAGLLKNARWLETLGYFNIQLGYMLKMGTAIGFKLVH
jgi:predicted dinucleotide-binding enzyme